MDSSPADSPSASFNNRDWVFPSHSFTHSSQIQRTPARRFISPYPRRPLATTFQAQQSPPTSSLNSPRITDHHHQPQQNYYSKYGGVRRRYGNFSQPRRNDKSSGQKDGDVNSIPGAKAIRRSMSDDGVSKVKQKGPTTPATGRHRLTGFLRGQFPIRWHMAFSLAMLVILLSSLVHKNFALHNEVIDLQERISELNTRLRLCQLIGSAEGVGSASLSIENLPSKNLKNTAFFISLLLLSFPFLFIKYVDYVSNSRRWHDTATEEVSLNKQLAYRVDLFLSVHPYAKPLALLVATLLLICLGGVALFGVTDDSLADCLWLSWTYVADSGNHANSEGLGPRLVSVSISFGGMLIFAMMLGLVSDAISEKFDSLRKGKSEVVEQNHTLILGWSDKLGSLLNQLAIANESLDGGIVVVMAERDKEEMELDIGKMEFDFRGTSVICRSGSPLILADLKKVSVSKARAIIVLAEDGNADQSDARALRTVLSLTGVKEGLRGHIVVELSDLDNEVLVKLVGQDLVETVVAHDVIGRLMIQCARQPGLAQELS